MADINSETYQEDLEAETREGITRYLVELGAQPAAAKDAVASLVTFRWNNNNTLVIVTAGWEGGAAAFQREAAKRLIHRIPLEFREGAIGERARYLSDISKVPEDAVREMRKTVGGAF
jgi:hypothetical protein